MHNSTAKDSIKSTTAKLDHNFLDNLKKGRYTHRQLNDMVYDELGHIHCTEVACQAYNDLASRRECPALGRGGQLPPPLPPSHSARVQLGWAGKVSTGKVCLLAAEEAMVPAWGGRGTGGGDGDGKSGHRGRGGCLRSPRRDCAGSTTKTGKHNHAQQDTGAWANITPLQ